MSRPDFRLDCQVESEVDDVPLSIRHVQVLVAATLYEAGAAAGEEIELGVSFVDPTRMAQLNGEHRDVEGPTDVLSFPIDGLAEPLPPGMPRQLGDVVACPEYVERQLRDGRTMAPSGPGQQGDATLEAALERCVVHGVLHLAGFDHERGEQAAAEMFALEQLVLDRVRST